jgi:predicted transcriptional regulator
MPTTNPRVMTTIEKPLYRWLERRARRDGVPLSTAMRDALREVYELEEERYWSNEAASRLATFDRSRALTHEEVRRKLAKRRA